MEDSGPEAEIANANDYPADEDSDHIEEESTSSHLSGQSSGSAPNWRNWRAQLSSSSRNGKDICWRSDDRQLKTFKKPQIDNLVDICARYVGQHFPFEAVERSLEQIPDVVQLKIAFYSFPEDEASIRLYSCLANGSVDEYVRGEQLYKSSASITDIAQIGFHLSATVSNSTTHPSSNEMLATFKTSVMFDRRKITACSCSCIEQRRGVCTCGASRPQRQTRNDVLHSGNMTCVCGEGKRVKSSQTWCSHIVALCLCRINEPEKVQLRTAISETLGKLERDQLQKFSQFLISKLPVQNLTVAQQILDELLSAVPNDINMACGAPDPTAGGCLGEHAGWLLDDKAVEEKLALTIAEFVKPAPQIYSDIQTLSADTSQISTEYMNLLRPLRGHEPEGVWNLLNIVRHMFRRQDSNALVLLQIVTRKILDAGKILLWWFHTKILVGEDHGGMRSNGFTNRGCIRNGPNCTNFSHAHHLQYHHHYVSGNNSSNAENAVFQRYAASSICDELVELWRIGALNPALESEVRSSLCSELIAMHKFIFECVQKQSSSNINNQSASNVAEWCSSEEGVSLFTRFRPAIEACLISWERLKDQYPVLLVDSSMGFYPHFGKHITNTNLDVSSLIHSELGNISIKSLEPDSVDEMFARAEALYAHGFATLAIDLARNLCNRIIEDPPVLVTEPSSSIFNPKENKATPFRTEYVQCVAVGQMLSRAQFLLNVLCSDSQWHLAYRVGIFAIDIPRPACFSKYLEVKLVQQEREVIECLRRLPPLGPNEFTIMRQKALQMCSGYYNNLGLRPPITLASYIFETLGSPNSSDAELGFQAALEGAGFKLPVCEVDHPMLYESFRHQKGELTIKLLLMYKDDETKLERIVNKVLDRQPESQKTTSNSSENSSVAETNVASSSNSTNLTESGEPEKNETGFRRVLSLPASSSPNAGDLTAEDSSAVEDEQEERAMAAKLRCVLTVRPGQNAPVNNSNLATGHPSGPDSSAPETTSSDNSPTFSRRGAGPSWRMPSSYSFGSESSNSQIRAQMQQQARTSGNQRWGSNSKSGVSGGGNNASRVILPTEPNQPSESAAQFIFELAKQVLQKAGGNSTPTYFQRAVQTRPHAGLHLCAFQIGLHALALHNAVNPTWLSRQYSTYGSWIILQAIEIGIPALRLLIEAWEGHFTPSEVARLADQAGRVPDRQIIRASVELACRALEFASCLSVAEVRRALDQCEELSLDKVKSACLAVEQAAMQSGTVPHDVLFATAEKLLDIYHKLQAKCSVALPQSVNYPSQNQMAQAVVAQPMVPPVVIAQQQAQVMPPNAMYVPNQGYGQQFNAYQAGYASYHAQGQQFLVPPYHAPQFVPVHMYQMQQLPSVPAGNQGIYQGFVDAHHHHQIAQQMPQFGLPQLPPSQQQQQQQQQAGIQSTQNQAQPQLQPQIQQQASQNQAQPQQPQQSNANQDSNGNSYFLFAAFRVGMLAMEQIRRNTEEKPLNIIKVSKAPSPLLGNVKWLFHTAVVIGADKVDDVCRLVLVALPDGTILHEICDQLEEYMAGLVQGGTSSSLQASLGPLQQTWNQMYHKALTSYRATIQHKTAHLLQAEQEDFMTMLTNAKRLFTKTPSGTKQFHDIMMSIKKSKNLRKEFTQRLLKSLASRSDGAPHSMY